MKRIFYTLILILLTTVSIARTSLLDMTRDTGVDVFYRTSQKELVVTMEQSQVSYLEVFNILGSKMMVVSLNSENSSVNLAKLPDGQYIVKISTTAGKLLTVKKIAIY